MTRLMPLATTSPVTVTRGVSRVIPPGAVMLTVAPAGTVSAAGAWHAFLTDVSNRTLAVVDEAYLEYDDLAGLSAIRHEPALIERLLRALARATASETTFQTLRTDVAGVAPSITAEMSPIS